MAKGGGEGVAGLPSLGNQDHRERGIFRGFLGPRGQRRAEEGRGGEGRGQQRNHGRQNRSKGHFVGDFTAAEDGLTIPEVQIGGLTFQQDSQRDRQTGLCMAPSSSYGTRKMLMSLTSLSQLSINRLISFMLLPPVKQCSSPIQAVLYCLLPTQVGSQNQYSPSFTKLAETLCQQSSNRINNLCCKGC